MNREIKFRAWDSAHKVFDLTVAANLLLQLHEPSEVLDSEYGQRFFLQQFTGLKDKNGVDIYEGDIVKRKAINLSYDEIDKPNEPKWKEEISSIIFRGSGFWIDSEDFGYEGEDLWDWDTIEVIGNIYKNPELIPT